MISVQDITALTNGLRAAFGQTDQFAAHGITSGWPETPKTKKLPEPFDLPVTKRLVQALENAPKPNVDLVRGLTKAANGLRWQQTYSADEMGRAFLERYGWVLLVAPDTPTESKSMLAGFLLLGPDVEYPVHRHAAEEVYVVLSGTTSWKIGDADWQPKPAGSVVHNPPWQTHGMRTDQSEPLLVGFAWNVGTVEKSEMMTTRSVEGN